MNYLELVAEWHRSFNVPVCASFAEVIKATCELRVALLDEEKNELWDAIAADNEIEQLDALCDLQYVLSGAVLHLGLTEQYKAAGEVYTSKYVPNEFPAATAAHLRTALFSVKLKNMENYLNGSNSAAVVICLHDLQAILSGLIMALGFAPVFEQAFMAIHMNNMIKYWGIHLVTNPAFTDDLIFEQYSGKFIAKNKAGKVIKPPGHTKVDLSQFIV